MWRVDDSSTHGYIVYYRIKQIYFNYLSKDVSFFVKTLFFLNHSFFYFFYCGFDLSLPVRDFLLAVRS